MPITTLRQACKNFFEWIERPDLFRSSAGRLEYADLLRLILLKIMTDGVQNPFSTVKHPLVDKRRNYPRFYQPAAGDRAHGWPTAPPPGKCGVQFRAC